MLNYIKWILFQSKIHRKFSVSYGRQREILYFAEKNTFNLFVNIEIYLFPITFSL